MKVDNPQAFRFIMQDELYLLDKDKGVNPVQPVQTDVANADEPAEAEATPEPVTEVAPTVVDPVAQSVLETPKPVFNYLGNNNKRFLILTNYPVEQFMADAHLAALESILKRKELALEDVVILNTYSYPTAAIKELHGHFKPEKILILGAAAIPSGLKQPGLNQPIRTSTIAILYSFSFDEMMTSNENKKAFWEQMKNL
ncbi:hypothetical protein [Mucilaginibacter sp.]|uniref:hypothetical protein n=1 Tax=Mucilaginibacter sp. TaxID=1882438 RepID=UPI0035BBCAB4